MTPAFTTVDTERASQPQMLELAYARWLAKECRGVMTPSA
jgi:hypothetical protein